MAWANVYDPKYVRPGIFLHFFLGGRGCGKTYGALKGAYEDYKSSGHKFYFMRRTDEERKLTEQFNPFNKVNFKEGWQIVSSPMGKKVSGFYEGERDDEGILKPAGQPIGYGLALSTIGSVRGLGLDDPCVDKGLFDEFIAELHARPIKAEGEAFLNAIESLNRNRELEGMEPITWYCMANSNRLDNPLFITLGIVAIVEKMIRREQRDYYDERRGFAVHVLRDADFEKLKKQTSIARLTEGSEYYDMAYENKFAYNDFTNIRRLDAMGFKPAYAIGDAHLWQRKGQTEYYASYKDGSFAYRYDPKLQADQLLGRSRHAAAFKRAYASGLVTFESYEIKALLLDFFAIK